MSLDKTDKIDARPHILVFAKTANPLLPLVKPEGPTREACLAKRLLAGVSISYASRTTLILLFNISMSTEIFNNKEATTPVFRSTMIAFGIC